MSENRDQNHFDLKDLISLDTVRSKKSPSSWEEAVEQVGELLVNAGKVKPAYINAMKRVFREMGPYAVIAPGIVLLHASPDDGVLSPSVGLITLSNPIEFGHSENDPVDIVIAFGAIDKHAHIAALKALAELLADHCYLQKIRSAQTDRDLLHAIVDEF